MIDTDYLFDRLHALRKSTSNGEFQQNVVDFLSDLVYEIRASQEEGVDD